MRIQYNVDNGYYYSPVFLIGTTQVQAIISTHTTAYSIQTVDTSEVLHFGHCNSIRMCKVNAKAKLKELGVVFNTETRRSND